MRGSVRKLPRQLARALWDRAAAEGAEEKVDRDLAALSRALRSDGRLRQVLLHPAVTLERKTALIESALGIAGPVAELARVLVGMKALAILGGVRRAYAAVSFAEARETVVRVESPASLDAAEKERVKEVMEKCLGRPVRVSVKTRRELIGGLLVRVGERIVDGTLKGMFDRLEAGLVAASSQVRSSKPQRAGRARRKGRK